MNTASSPVPDGPAAKPFRSAFFRRVRIPCFPQWLLRHAYPIALALVILVLLAPMVREGMWKGHDGSSHILRLHNTISALQTGQFPPVINSAQENAFGYSWNLFYPPLSAYLAAAATLGLETLGVSSPFTGMKLTWLTIIFAAAASMYFFLSHVFRSRFAASMGTILYITAPYFISCVYIRFALGEVMMFVFLPLLATGAYSVFYENGDKNYLLTVGTAGIILSNVPASFILLLCLIFFTLLHVKSLSNTRILRQLGVNIIFTSGIAAFFYVPLFEQWAHGNIVAFTNMTGASLESLQNQGVKLWWLILPRKIVRMFFYYGFPILFCAGWLFLKTPQKRWTKIIALFCLLLSFAMSKWMPWAYVTPFFFNFVTYIQFPWRMLGVTIFLLSTLAAYNSEQFFLRENRPRTLLITAVLCIIGTLFIFPSGRYATIVRPETHTVDYLPSKSVPFKEKFAAMKAVPVISSGAAHIENLEKTGSTLSFLINHVQVQTIVEMPYFAYLGYSAMLKTSKGAEMALPLHESDKGLWSVTIPENVSGKVIMAYTGTPASRAGYRISQAALGIFGCYIFCCVRQQRRKAFYVQCAAMPK